MTAEEVKNEQPEMAQKNGMKMCGYTIPWWVLLVVVLLIVYVVYDQGYFRSMTSAQPRQITLPMMQTGGNFGAGLDTPMEIRQLFKGNL